METIKALYRFLVWLVKASLAILGIIVLLGEANHAVPDLIQRGEELGLKPAIDGSIGVMDNAVAIVRYMVTEHFVLLAILVVSFGVCHHMVVGKPLDSSRVEFQRRRGQRPGAKKGRRK